MLLWSIPAPAPAYNNYCSYYFAIANNNILFEFALKLPLKILRLNAFTFGKEF